MLFPIQAVFGGIRAECEPVLNPNQELPLKGLCLLLSFFFFFSKHAKSWELILESSLAQGCFWQAQGC